MIEPSPWQSDKCCCKVSRAKLSQSATTCTLWLMTITLDAEACHSEKESLFPPYLCSFGFSLLCCHPNNCCYSRIVNTVLHNSMLLGKKTKQAPDQCANSGQSVCYCLLTGELHSIHNRFLLTQLDFKNFPKLGYLFTITTSMFSSQTTAYRRGLKRSEHVTRWIESYAFIHSTHTHTHSKHQYNNCVRSGI